MSQNYLEELAQLGDYLREREQDDYNYEYILERIVQLELLEGKAQDYDDTEVNYLSELSKTIADIFSRNYCDDPELLAQLSKSFRDSKEEFEGYVSDLEENLGYYLTEQFISIVGNLESYINNRFQEIIEQCRDDDQWLQAFTSTLTTINNTPLTLSFNPVEEKKITVEEDEEEDQEDTTDPEEHVWDETELVKETCYDPINLEDTPVKDYIETDSKDNIILLQKQEGKSPIKIDCFTRSALIQYCSDTASTFYECKTNSLSSSSVTRDVVYTKIPSTILGNFMVSKKELLGAVQNPNNFTLIVEKIKDIPRMVSVEVMDHQGSFISAAHCQDGSGAPLYKIWKCGGDKCLKSVF